MRPAVCYATTRERSPRRSEVESDRLEIVLRAITDHLIPQRVCHRLRSHCLPATPHGAGSRISRPRKRWAGARCWSARSTATPGRRSRRPQPPMCTSSRCTRCLRSCRRSLSSWVDLLRQDDRTRLYVDSGGIKEFSLELRILRCCFSSSGDYCVCATCGALDHVIPIASS